MAQVSYVDFIGKVVEGFTLHSLVSEVSGKLDTKQFAMPRKSTTQALVYILHLIHAGLDMGHCYARLFFADFRKGFDLVDHVIISELHNLNVHPTIIRWIKAFLTGPEQSVKVAMVSSSWKRMNGGLPQGTKLVPILFSILINSLLKDWQGRVKFVDDTTLLEIVSRCSPSLLCTVVDEIFQFASSRVMELNPKKCKEMIISFLKYSLPSNNTIYVSGLPVERVSSFKLLGLLISDDLSWNCHVDYVIQKANSRLYALCLLMKAGLSHLELVNIYCSFIRE